MKIERNSQCTCGSGKKYKKCCLMSERKPIQVVEIFSEMHEVCDNALAQIEAGDLLSAEMEAERLYHLHPDDHMVNFLKGICCIQRECYQQAISFFETAIQINPWFSEAYFNLASLYRQEMKIPQSVVYFRKIIEIEGERGDLGKLAKKELDWLEKMLQKTSGQTLTEYLQASALFDEAFACLRREEHQKAISLFQQVLALNPDHVQSYGNMALAHSALGEQKIALQYLDKALSLDPTYEPAQQNRENIIRLKEGERSPFKMAAVLYYREKFELEGKKKQKPRALTWSNAAIGYVHQDAL
ncbi:MAG: tetratricopeptide repeat protein [Verrucomicrobia bacterium]|nr:tetratricopeptide repeat protein [Verrucomicrobiota bacterium]